MKDEYEYTPDTALFFEYQHSMEGIDQSYAEWLESELKTAREFQQGFEAMELLYIKHGIDTQGIRNAKK
jgi:hypothetical protein